MNDNAFLEHVFNYAEALKRSPLSDLEKEEIVKAFNGSAGDAFTRASNAIKSTLGLTPIQEEIRKIANIDNTNRLLLDLQMAASQWQDAKK